ncbi:hypothetical protein LCGC14_1235990 [marine sediment metagenome]|uniref:Uncharacterized protein n=1 Tax=marine sediment metagenome TaxID=412755 RepID=A0A0F9L790_9ZZZZ
MLPAKWDFLFILGGVNVARKKSKYMKKSSHSGKKKVSFMAKGKRVTFKAKKT